MNKFEEIQERIIARRDFVFLGKPGVGNVKTITENNPDAVVMNGNGLLDGRLCMHVYRKLLINSERKPNQSQLLFINGFARVKNSGVLSTLLTDRKFAKNELPANVVIGLYDDNYEFDRNDEVIADAREIFGSLNQDTPEQ